MARSSSLDAVFVYNDLFHDRDMDLVTTKAITCALMRWMRCAGRAAGAEVSPVVRVASFVHKAIERRSGRGQVCDGL